MPAISTRGGMSARGFGMNQNRKLLPAYPAGQFAVYYAGTVFSKFTFASNSSEAYGASGLTATTATKPCCANVWEGLYNMGPTTSLVCKLLVWSQGTIASWSPGLTTAVQGKSGTGNATIGVLATTQGNVIAGTNIYTFVAGTIAVGNNLEFIMTDGSACSSPTFGLFTAGGTFSNPPAKLNDKYYFSNGAVASGTAFPLYVTRNGATSNSAFAIICRGYSAAGATYKYTWASDVVATTTAMKTNAQDAGAWGNEVCGVFARLTSPDLSRYQYADDSTVAITAYANVAQGAQGATNGIPGVSYFG